MQIRTILANRIAHVGSLIIVALAILVILRDLEPIMRTVIAVLPVIGWYFGLIYERSLVLVNGLVDEDELKAIEREATKLF